MTAKNVNIVERTELKNGVVLYEILSSDSVTTYFATVEHGKVTAHDCPGYEYRGTCRHAQYIEQLEAMHQYDVVCVAREIIADTLIGDAYEVLAPTKSQPVYGTCGHLARRADTHCGCGQYR